MPLLLKRIYKVEVAASYATASKFDETTGIQYKENTSFCPRYFDFVRGKTFLLSNRFLGGESNDR